MAYQYFGQWLLDRKLISPEALQKATLLQDQTNLPLGAIAIQVGLLSPAMVEEINREQQRTDRHFGEIAQEQYLLKPSQVEELLAEQKKRQLQLGQALVLLGYLEESLLLHELTTHRQYQQTHLSAIYTRMNSFSNAGIIKAFIDITIKLFGRIIHENFMIDSVSTDNLESKQDQHRIQQKVDGDNSFSLVMALPETFVTKIESKLHGQESTSINESSLSAAKDLVKIISSNACSKAKEKQIHLNMSSPEILQTDAGYTEGKENILACFVSPQERFQLQLGFQ